MDTLLWSQKEDGYWCGVNIEYVGPHVPSFLEPASRTGPEHVPQVYVGHKPGTEYVWIACRRDQRDEVRKAIEREGHEIIAEW